MDIKFKSHTSSEIQKEIKHYPSTYDVGFEYNEKKSPRFNVQAVAEHCEILLNNFSKALDNVVKRAPLTYERAWYTNHASPLILDAAIRSEKRLLSHVVRYTESKYVIDISTQQQALGIIAKTGRTAENIKKAADIFALPPIDIAIVQYCHMLSSACYQDDILRQCHRIYGEGSQRFKDCMPSIDLPFPLKRFLDSRNGKHNESYESDESDKESAIEDAAAPGLEYLNGKYPGPDYLHWPEGEPAYEFNRLLDEVPERMMCARCDRDIYFTKDGGESWSSFLSGEDVLCRYCGSINNILTLRWRYLRDDLLKHIRAIRRYRDFKRIEGYIQFPDIVGRQTHGPGIGKRTIDKILRNTVSDVHWDRIVKILSHRDGRIADWDSLLGEFRATEDGLPPFELDPALITHHEKFWTKLVLKYKTSFNKWISVDLEASIANLRCFTSEIERFKEFTKDGPQETEQPVKLVSKILRKFKRTPDRIAKRQNCIPKGSGIQYERFMKLRAKFPTKTLLPTTAITLLWRTHLLYPSYYHHWCLQTLDCWVEHKFDIMETKPIEDWKQMYEETFDLWWAEYSEEYIPDQKNWIQYFPIRNHLAGDLNSSYNRPGLIKAEEYWEAETRAMSAFNEGIKSTLSLGFERPNHDHPADDLTIPEQEELYHTVFDSAFTRQLITAKLVLQSMCSRESITEPESNPMTACLSTHIDTSWNSEHDQIMEFTVDYPAFNLRILEQVDHTIIAIQLLFSYDAMDITKEILFQPRSLDDGKKILSKRLLLWLCVRNHRKFRPRYRIPEFFKQLHNDQVLLYRVEISPCDLASARAVSFIEEIYGDVVRRVVAKCEPLFLKHVPKRDEYGVPMSPEKARAELDLGMQDFETTTEIGSSVNLKTENEKLPASGKFITPNTRDGGGTKLPYTTTSLPRPTIRPAQTLVTDSGDGDGRGDGDRGDGDRGDGGWGDGGWGD